MKPSRFLLSILAISLVSAAVPMAKASGPSSAPVAAASVDRDSFRKDFRKAMDIGAQDRMQDLIKRNQADAVDAIVTLCTSLGGANNDAIEEEINALRIAWKGAMKTNFVEKVYEYYSLLDGTSRKERVKLVNSISCT